IGRVRRVAQERSIEEQRLPELVRLPVRLRDVVEDRRIRQRLVRRLVLGHRRLKLTEVVRARPLFIVAARLLHLAPRVGARDAARRHRDQHQPPPRSASRHHATSPSTRRAGRLREPARAATANSAARRRYRLRARRVTARGARYTRRLRARATYNVAMGDDGARSSTMTDASGPRPAASDSAMPAWDRYRDEGLLGEGASGRVYKAWDAILKRHVALKFLRADSEEWSRRLVRESQAQARVEHEHVCKVYEAGEHEGRPYIAMQFVNGPTLAQASREMSLEEKVRLMIGVADALHAAHRLGVIHRDIKPSNILVERTESGWKPYVADFGLARELASLHATVTGAAGTPQYMSPEQARGDNSLVDRRSDV